MPSPVACTEHCNPRILWQVIDLSQNYQGEPSLPCRSHDRVALVLLFLPSSNFGRFLTPPRRGLGKGRPTLVLLQFVVNPS